MKWLDERPRPIHETWNILCDAIEERIGAFRIDWDEEYLPPRLPAVPFSKTKFDVSGLRGKIITLIKYSFFPPWFGKWSDLRIDNLGIDRPDGEFYRELGIDGNAFFMRAGEDVPRYKYSLNNFIHAAAKIVNDAILYPMPGVETGDRAGFLLDADLEIEVLDEEYNPPNYHWTGSYSKDGIKSIYWDYDEEYGSSKYCSSSPTLLVSYQREVARSRSSNHRWKYCKPGGRMDGRPFDYYNPVLRGYGKVRSINEYCSYTNLDSSNGYDKVSIPDQEFIIDFSTGFANKQVDLSPVQKWRDLYWNPSEDDVPYWTLAAVNYNRGKLEIYLTKDNFPELNYKYWSE